MSEWQATRGLEILGLTYGLGANNPDLIFAPEFFEPGEIQSQITNWSDIRFINYGPGMDAYIHFRDDATLPLEARWEAQTLYVQGDLSRLDREGKDRRWSLLGNIGLFFRYALTVQERHGIYSFHASSIYRPDTHELLVIVGKAGAGKTVYLLEGLVRGYQIFSTEMTFFRLIPEGVAFYRGALLDNIRVGNFKFDFPEATERLGLTLPETDDPWNAKISVDLSGASTADATLINPTLSFVFPRIEKGYDHSIVSAIKNPRALKHALFDSLSEKIGATTLLYETFPVIGLDTPELAQARWEVVSQLVDAPKWTIKQAKNILAGPKSSMEGID